MPDTKVQWTGASRKKYDYWLMKLPYSCDPGQDGNYIICKMVTFQGAAKLNGKKAVILSIDRKLGTARVKTEAGEKTVQISALTEIKEPQKRWVAVYIGEGDLNDRVNDREHYACAVKNGATHVCVHLNPSEPARIAEEKDLLASNPEAYVPTGCNQKKGG